MYEKEARELYESLPLRNKLALRHAVLVAWRGDPSGWWEAAIEGAVEDDPSCSRSEVESVLQKTLAVGVIADVIEDQRALFEETVGEGVDTSTLCDAARNRILLETYLFNPRLEVKEAES